MCALFLLAACSAPSSARLPVRPCSIVTRTHVAEFKCEVAADAASQETGLKNRSALPADYAMLFVFDAPKRASFWMKDTLVPLDMLFVTSDGAIESIVSNAKPKDETLHSSIGDVAAVIEINGGEAARRQIRVGDKLRSRGPFGNN